MEHLLLIIVGILLLIIFVLVAKVYFLHKSAQEIAETIFWKNICLSTA